MADETTDTTPANGSRKSFTARKPPIPFDIDGEDFMALAVLPAADFGRFAEGVMTLQRTSSDYEGRDKVELPIGEQIELILDLLELCLTEESARRLADRIRDKANPVDLGTMGGMLLWLLEEYGLADRGDARPQQATSD